MGTRTLGTRTLVLAGLAAALVAWGAADAQAGVNARQANQRARIAHGVSNGSLSGGEAHRLIHEQVRTERLEHRFRANDGRLGPRERHRLNHRLNRSNRHIYRGKHNGR